MSVNIGHGHPHVVKAIKRAGEQLVVRLPGHGHRGAARAEQAPGRAHPGDINTFFYTLGGAEANENAIKAARSSRGATRSSRATAATTAARTARISLTGDPRRWPNEPACPASCA
jgi:taurine--2-oxoglutarate transaminase